MPFRSLARTMTGGCSTGTVIGVVTSSRGGQIVASLRGVARSIPRSVWILIGVLVAVRVGFAFVLGLDEARLIEPDSNDYLSNAEALLDDGRFLTAPGSDEPEFERTPGYPLFIAVILVVTGRSILAVALAQAALSALVALPMFLIARRLFGERAGVVAVVLFIADPLSLYFGAMVMTETLAALLLGATVALLGLLMDRHSSSSRGWLIVGVLLAVTTFVRPGQYYLPVVILGLLIWTARRGGWSLASTSRATAAMLVPLVVLVGGWQIRNAVEVGSTRFSGIEAVNMMKYRAAGVVAEREGGDWREVRRELMDVYGPGFEGATVGEYYDNMYDKGMELVLDDPVSLMKVTLSGAWRGAVSFPADIDGFITRWNLPDLLVVRLVVDYAMVPVWLVALWGLGVAWRRASSRPVVLAAVVPVVYLFALSSGPESYARFRVPVMPVLWLFVAGGAVALFDLFRSRARRPSG